MNYVCSGCCGCNRCHGGREGSQAIEKVIGHEGRLEHGWIPGGKEGRK